MTFNIKHEKIPRKLASHKTVTYHMPGCGLEGLSARQLSLCLPNAFRGIGNIALLCTSLPETQQNIINNRDNTQGVDPSL